jgi:hypothetical protein
MRNASIYAAGMLYAGGVTLLSRLVLLYARGGFPNRKSRFNWPTERFLSRSDQFCSNCIPDQLGGR